MSRAMPRACTSAQRQPPLAAMRSSLACGAARGLRDGTVTRARRQSVGLQRQARASVAQRSIDPANTVLLSANMAMLTLTEKESMSRAKMLTAVPLCDVLLPSMQDM